MAQPQFDKAKKKTAARLDEQIGRVLDDSIAARLLADEGWADELRQWLSALAVAQRNCWEPLLRDAAAIEPEPPATDWKVRIEETGLDYLTDGEAAIEARDRMQLDRAPSRAWRQRLAAHVSAVGAAELKQRVQQCLHNVPGSRPGNLARQSVNRELLRGLLWLCVDVFDGELVQAMQRAATWFYQNNSPLGEASVAVLYQLPGNAGAAALATLAQRVQAQSQKQYLQTALAALAQRLGVSPEDLADEPLPTFGFSEAGKWTHDFGDARVDLLLERDRTLKTAWTKADGRQLKSTPARIKREHADELKDLKARNEGVREALAGLAMRLESSWLSQRTWSTNDWRRQFIDHPIAGRLGRALIWRFTNQDRHWDACGDSELAAHEAATVALWHPLGIAAEEVHAWRERLEVLQITQPFKQAHRELYVLTDAERSTGIYSNRFAGHILRQAQLRRLAKIRGWRTELAGPWDAGGQSAAQRVLPRWQLRAEFWVSGAGDEFQTGYTYLSSDQVRFYRIDEQLPLPLAEVPPLVFSEVMRDVDLFVGVTSIGNDPQWLDRGADVRFGPYWRQFSFGELSAAAKTRREVLQRLIPRLKIADRCQLEERFLVVRGDLRSYKIHLGSGNVLMLPNDEYLCIVPKPDPQAGSIMLPFEGDATLSIILSKALLLADDRSIPDPTITSQIQGAT